MAAQSQGSWLDAGPLYQETGLVSQLRKTIEKCSSSMAEHVLTAMEDSCGTRSHADSLTSAFVGSGPLPIP
jgi:hypothetical protein